MGKSVLAADVVVASLYRQIRPPGMEIYSLAEYF
jgi:hypothetical protein